MNGRHRIQCTHGKRDLLLTPHIPCSCEFGSFVISTHALHMLLSTMKSVKYATGTSTINETFIRPHLDQKEVRRNHRQACLWDVRSTLSPVSKHSRHDFPRIHHIRKISTFVLLIQVWVRCFVMLLLIKYDNAKVNLAHYLQAQYICAMIIDNQYVCNN